MDVFLIVLGSPMYPCLEKQDLVQKFILRASEKEGQEDSLSWTSNSGGSHIRHFLFLISYVFLCETISFNRHGGGTQNLEVTWDSVKF